MPNLTAESPFLIGRFVVPVILFAGLPLAPLAAQEKPVAALHDFISAEVRQQGFTLPAPAKIHVYARGGGIEPRWGRENHLFAYGWLLNATTREVVWRMDFGNSRRDGFYRISDQYLDLPAGSYEAYFSNHGFGRETLFTQWIRNIDRRHLPSERSGHEVRGLRLHAFFGADSQSHHRYWRERATNYGMELYLPEAAQAQTFTAPLRWKNIVVDLTKVGDNGQWDQGFHLSQPTTLHVYAIGEGRPGRDMNDGGWILDVRTRKRVWEMRADKARYAGGAGKNLRQVETLQLPAGDYVASFATDDSHSPDDWNEAPPCDPAMYGLTLAVPSDAEMGHVTAIAVPRPGAVLAEVVRVKDDTHRKAAFEMKRDGTVQVYAIGEGTSQDMADYAWIEDGSGKRVWTMEYASTHHAGGGLKNRLLDERIALAKGGYTLHFRTDDSHAYGDWNAAPPRDPEHYGATVYAVAP